MSMNAVAQRCESGNLHLEYPPAMKRGEKTEKEGEGGLLPCPFSLTQIAESFS
jgi:hypothetical protein